MKPGNAILIRYRSDEGMSDTPPPIRTIIPIHVPEENVNVLSVDISDLMLDKSFDICRTLEQQITEYNEYRQQRLSQILGFSAWREQSYGDTTPLKYRSFVKSKIVEVAD